MTFRKPAAVPPKVRYDLTAKPPKIEMPDLTWAPVLVDIDAADPVTTSDERVCPSSGIGETGSSPVHLTAFGRTTGLATLRLQDRTPVADPPQLAVTVKDHRDYRVALRSPALEVRAPDARIKPYRLDETLPVSSGWDTPRLVSEILAKIGSRTFRHLVFNAHGFAGQIEIFGKSATRVLDTAELRHLAPLRGRFDTVWVLACFACGDPAFHKGLATALRADTIGAGMAQPELLSRGRNEVDFHKGAQPRLILSGGTGQFIADWVMDRNLAAGTTSVGVPHAHFVPA